MKLLVSFDETCFKSIDQCPWCGSNKFGSKALYCNEYDATVHRCQNCGFVYSDKILNEHGIEEYWKGYEAENGDYSDEMIDKRNKMYDIEFQYLNSLYDCKGKKVLEVGCGDAGFLDKFCANGALCFGTEIRKPAIIKASERYRIYEGDLSEIVIDEKFDFILLRGVIQYFFRPIQCFDKLVSLLNKGGVIYITSTPNADSICFNLFKERFTLPVGVFDYWGYSESVLTRYLKKKHIRLKNKTNLYMETPYANIRSDIKRVSEAIEDEDAGRVHTFNSPPFFDNMLTLVYVNEQ